MVGVTVLMNGGSGTEDAPRALVATREYTVDR